MALAVVVLMAVAWLMLHEPPEVQRAKGVRLGQTAEEVLDVMGRDNYTQFNGNPMSLVFGRVRDMQHVYSSKIMQKTGVGGLQPDRDDWPVHIRFDAKGRVDRIKRGSEIVE
jgi:hypothetical protein